MVLLLLLIGVSALNPVYENSRSFVSGLMSGYQGSDYVFPTKMCFNTTTQIAINDALIGIALFAPLNNDVIVERQINILKNQITNTYNSCDLDLFFTSIATNLEEVGLIRWVTRLWWNSILIYRYYLEVQDSCSKYLYQDCGQDLGTLIKYVFTPTS